MSEEIDNLLKKEIYEIVLRSSVPYRKIYYVQSGVIDAKQDLMVKSIVINQEFVLMVALKNMDLITMRLTHQ